MGPVKVGAKLYDPDIVVRAFKYFATSRSLYSKLRDDYQFPSIRTLTKITSAIASKGDSSFLKGIFKPLTPKQRSCVIIQDEVYVKKSLTYAGTIFGKAANDPTLLADTMLGIMINNLHGGPTFVDKMIPETKMTANYLYDTVDLSVS